jgi:hypothetical protein
MKMSTSDNLKRKLNLEEIVTVANMVEACQEDPAHSMPGRNLWQRWKFY